MLTILYPEVLIHLRDFNYGLLPLWNNKTNSPFLIIKATKEGILTVKTNNEFKLYLVRDSLTKFSYLGLITAFFDDHDEPLNIMSPLFFNDDMVTDIAMVFSQTEFEIFFFDENNYELLGVKAKNSEAARFHLEIQSACFNQFDPRKTLENWQQMEKEFGLRTLADDEKAFTIDCTERLYPDDVFIMDLRTKFHGYNDQADSIASSTLERDGDPGPMQEKDLTRLFLRIFEPTNIYLNPFRDDTGRELADLMIVTDKIMFFVQAKDSPNTEMMLKRHIDRKRTTTRNHIKKASSQVKGALTYARNNLGVTIETPSGKETIPLDGRQLIGLIVVKELFDDDYIECSAPILKVVRELDIPVGLFDYSQLNVLTQRLGTPGAFIDGLYKALDVALKNEQFPKSVHSGAIMS